MRGRPPPTHTHKKIGKGIRIWGGTRERETEKGRRREGKEEREKKRGKRRTEKSETGKKIKGKGEEKKERERGK